MAENRDTTISLKTVADNSGAESAKKAHAEVGDAAKKAGDATAQSARKAADATAQSAHKAADAAEQSAQKAAGAWQKFSGAVSAVGKAVGTVTRALGIVGFAMNAIETLVGWYKKLHDWLDSDKKAAEELARQIQDAKNVAAVEAVEAAYDRLKAKIDEVARIESERDRLADRRLSRQRADEDAQSELEMQQELAGLGRDDPDYAENAALVRSKYARIRADRAAKRATQDRITKQSRMLEQADEKRTEADDIEKEVTGKSGDKVIALKGQIAAEKDAGRRQKMEEQLERMVAAQRKKLAEAKKLREEADSIQKEALSLFGDERAAKINAQAVNVAQDAADADTRRRIESNRAARERDAREKKRNEEDAEAGLAEQQEIAALDATAPAYTEKVALVRSKYTRLRAGRTASRAREDGNGGERTADINAQTVNVAQDVAEAAAKRKINAKAAQRDADEETVIEGPQKIGELQSQAEFEEARAQKAADAYAKEAGEAHDAQDRYDMLVQNGGSRKEKSAALAALQKEQREAEEAKHEMERVAAEVANTLQGISAQIKALAGAVKKAEGRLAQNQADAPEG